MLLSTSVYVSARGFILREIVFGERILFIIVPLPVSTILDALGRDFVVFTYLAAVLFTDRVADKTQNEVGKS